LVPYTRLATVYILTYPNLPLPTLPPLPTHHLPTHLPYLPTYPCLPTYPYLPFLFFLRTFLTELFFFGVTVWEVLLLDLANEAEVVSKFSGSVILTRDCARETGL
jgi:hypothetical protein